MPSLIVFREDRLWKVVRITQDAVTVGRGPTSDLVLDHTSVSRAHAELVRAGGGYRIVDQGSTNRLQVNGRVVSSAPLTHGDEIQLGIFTLHYHGDHQELASSPTTAIPAEEMARLQESYRRMKTLLEFAAKSPPAGHTAELLEMLLDCLLQVFSAERGFVLLADRRSGELKPAMHRGADPIGTISNTIARRVASEDRSILITDVEAEAEYSKIASIQKTDVRSIIAAPLKTGDRCLGVIYLDSQVKSRQFLPEDLKLLEESCRLVATMVDASQEVYQLRRDVTRLKALEQASRPAAGPFAEIVGQSPRLVDVLQQAKAAAQHDVTVLIFGETGTGKEGLARAMHLESSRSDGPWVAVNCVALAKDLVESELFGHEKGAFTGAADRRIGRFEMADGGTLFLDEIGELSLDLQTKMLRVLEQRQVERVGSTKPIDVDVRLVCATNRDLQAMVDRGAFRQDLYYRINVLGLTLPPLRERKEDIPLLVDHFVDHFRRQTGRIIRGVTDEALEALTAYSWRGNIRELRNVIERAFVLETGDRLTVASLPFGLVTDTVTRKDPKELDWSGLPREYAKAREVFETSFFVQALRRHGGCVASAAEELGLPRQTLSRKIETLGVDAQKIHAESQLAERARLAKALEKANGDVTEAASNLGIPRNTLLRKLQAHRIPVRQDRSPGA